MSTSRQPYCAHVVIVPNRRKLLGFNLRKQWVVSRLLPSLACAGFRTLSPINSHPPRTLEPCLPLCLPPSFPPGHLIFQLVSSLSPPMFPTLSHFDCHQVAVSRLLPFSQYPVVFQLSPTAPRCLPDVVSPMCLPLVSQLSLRGAQ